MNLTNNILLHTSESKETELSVDYPSLELNPIVAYIVTMSSLTPLLEKSYIQSIAESIRSDRDIKNTLFTPTKQAAAPERINKLLEGHMENIKDKLEYIKKVIDELKEKAAFFMGLLSKGENHYIVGKEWEEFEKKFIYSTKRIMDTVTLIRESIKKLRSILSKNAKYPALNQIEKYCQSLLDKIPDPSSKWNPETAEYDGSKWMHKSINDKEKTIFLGWETWFKGIKNPVGLLERMLDKDTSKKDDYLKTIGNGLDSVEELFANIGKYSRMLEREEIFKHLASLDTQEAYVYIISTVLPMLQNESTAGLDEAGKTMKIIAGIYDKWNEIQDLINKSIKQDTKDATAADNLGNKIKKMVQDIQYELKRAKIYLPSSSHSLLDTMKELSNKLVTEYPKDFFKVAGDSDQTAFKIYIDNIGQGITALTSISNMAQQQLQIETQYYNSLLGFQKSAQDSLNKSIQAALNNMRPV